MLIALLDTPSGVDAVIPNTLDYRTLMNNIALHPCAYLMFMLHFQFGADPADIEIIARKIFEPEVIETASKHVTYDETTQMISLAVATDTTRQEAAILNLDWLQAAEARENALDPSNAQTNGAQVDYDLYSDDGSINTQAYNRRRYGDADEEDDSSQQQSTTWSGLSHQRSNVGNSSSAASQAAAGDFDPPHAQDAFVGGVV